MKYFDDVAKLITKREQLAKDFERRLKSVLRANNIVYDSVKVVGYFDRPSVQIFFDKCTLTLRPDSTKREEVYYKSDFLTEWEESSKMMESVKTLVQREMKDF